MKFQVYDELPVKNAGHASRFAGIYNQAIDAACEHEPKWVRVDELAHAKNATASTRSASLRKHAAAYAQRTGLSGSDVKQRRVDGKAYPFIRKIPNGGAS